MNPKDIARTGDRPPSTPALRYTREGYNPPPMADVTAFPDHNTDGPDWAEVTVVGEDERITPSQAEITEWATQYVGPVSAKAYAKHIWTKWNDYEPEGDYSIGLFLRDTLDQWRGLDAPPARAPYGSAYLSEEDADHNRHQLDRVSTTDGARSVKLSDPTGETQWLRISNGLFCRLKEVLTSPH